MQGSKKRGTTLFVSTQFTPLAFSDFVRKTFNNAAQRERLFHHFRHCFSLLAFFFENMNDLARRRPGVRLDYPATPLTRPQADQFLWVICLAFQAALDEAYYNQTDLRLEPFQYLGQAGASTTETFEAMWRGSLLSHLLQGINAGTGTSCSLEELTDDAWQALSEISMNAAQMFCTLAAAVEAPQAMRSGDLSHKKR